MSESRDLGVTSTHSPQPQGLTPGTQGPLLAQTPRLLALPSPAHSSTQEVSVNWDTAWETAEHKKGSKNLATSSPGALGPVSDRCGSQPPSLSAGEEARAGSESAGHTAGALDLCGHSSPGTG